MKPLKKINHPPGFVSRERSDTIHVGDVITNNLNRYSIPVPVGHKLIGLKVEDVPLGYVVFRPRSLNERKLVQLVDIINQARKFPATHSVAQPKQIEKQDI